MILCFLRLPLFHYISISSQETYSLLVYVPLHAWYIENGLDRFTYLFPPFRVFFPAPAHSVVRGLFSSLSLSVCNFGYLVPAMTPPDEYDSTFDLREITTTIR